MTSKYSNNRKDRNTKSKAQVSMEYLMVFSVAFLMTLPLIIIYITQTQNVRADVTNAEMYKIASKISDYAEEVYFIGPPSQRTINLHFPEGIDSVTLTNNTIIFNVTTADRNYLVEKETIANISGTIKSFEGQHIIVFKAEQNHVTIMDQ
jgi:hypothetical protein